MEEDTSIVRRDTGCSGEGCDSVDELLTSRLNQAELDMCAHLLGMIRNGPVGDFRSFRQPACNA